MNNMSQKLSFGEVSAEIRNKLQAGMSALEVLKSGKKVPEKLVDLAIKDLEKIIDIIH